MWSYSGKKGWETDREELIFSLLWTCLYYWIDSLKYWICIALFCFISLICLFYYELLRNKSKCDTSLCPWQSLAQRLTQRTCNRYLFIAGLKLCMVINSICLVFLFFCFVFFFVFIEFADCMSITILNLFFQSWGWRWLSELYHSSGNSECIID